jgi:hypothetical protein
MRVLLDECLPREFARCSEPHAGTSVVQFAYLPGRKKESLITFADGIFDVFLTFGGVDPKFQKLRPHRTAVITLSAKSNRLKDLKPLAQKLVTVLGTIKPGEILQVGDR